MRSQRTNINDNTVKTLKVISWNINGITGKRQYMRLLIEKHDPDIVFLCETKRNLVISMHNDLACDDTYRAVQLKSTNSNRGGIIVLIKAELQLVTAEIKRVQNGNDFAQAVVLTDREERAYVGWYSSPVMSRAAFKETITKIHNDYDVQFFTGDFNARHPRWCTNHDGNRRGTQLLQHIRNHPEYQIHATRENTFEAVANRAEGTIRKSTVDLTISKATITDLSRITGFVASCSDHYPIMFTVKTQMETATRPRRVAKTLLQSKNLRTAIGLWYELSLRQPIEALTAARADGDNTMQSEEIQEVYEKAEQCIIEPWVNHTKEKKA